MINPRRRWTLREDKLVMANAMSDELLSCLIIRSVNAIKRRRRYLLKRKSFYEIY